MKRAIRRWCARVQSTNAALHYMHSPSRSLWREFRERSTADFLRHLMRIEREQRLVWLAVLKSWYRKQIFVSQCTQVGSGLKVGPDPIRVMRGDGGELLIGENVIIYTPCEFVIATHIFPHSRIVVGYGTHLGTHCSIRAARDVRIGEGCLIAPWVRIFDYNGHPLAPGNGRIGAPTPPDEVSPVCIGDNVWIGENAFVQRGVTIGDNSIVSANSVVTKDVPPNTVVMGNPARVCRWLDKDGRPE